MLRALDVVKSTGVASVDAVAVVKSPAVTQVDAIVTVVGDSADDAAFAIQSVVAQLLADDVAVKELKAGAVDAWRLVPGGTSLDDKAAVHNRIDQMVHQGLLVPSEASRLRSAVQTATTVDTLRLQQLARPHLMRWTPAEVKAAAWRSPMPGDIKSVSLQDALQSGELVKLTAVDRRTDEGEVEYTFIFQIYVRDRLVTQPLRAYVDALADNITDLAASDKFFKALKRMHVWATRTNDERRLAALSEFFASTPVCQWVEEYNTMYRAEDQAYRGPDAWRAAYDGDSTWHTYDFSNKAQFLRQVRLRRARAWVALNDLARAFVTQRALLPL